MALPRFLIIGAMKAGTTSLAADLATLPDVFIPSVKEPHFLFLEPIDKSKENYDLLFRKAAPHQTCGEASTGYTMLPDAPGIPPRAKQVLGPKLRLVYIVRNPVARALSHHYQMAREGLASFDVNAAIREVPPLLNYGRYAMQLQPWMQEFGRNQIHIVIFEDYIANRLPEMEKVARFLQVKIPDGWSADQAVHNRGESAIVPRIRVSRLLGRTLRSPWYKIWIHPNLPRTLSRMAKCALMTAPPPRPAPPTRETAAFIIEQTRNDAKELQSLLGYDRPIWDLDRILEEIPAAEDEVSQSFDYT